MATTDARGRPGCVDHDAAWRQPSLVELLGRPLPELGLLDRSLTRLVSYCVLHRFRSISGLQHVAATADPFILALNHSTRLEALALPALLMYHRDGRRVHFLADWNFQMIPGVGLLYRRSGAIVVTRKSARPRFLNVLKPLYAHAEPSLERARTHLKSGNSVGIFPEGTVNRDPERLLRGRLGAARLSLETGVPIVAGGIRVVGGTPERPILDLAFGAPIRPPRAVPGHAASDKAASADVRLWHSQIMTEIARLSGKAWEPLPQEPRHGTP
ncbi:MAG: lysophospholipid acyltransferase family protein [Hyphomicrobiaceae bacterium]|nr:lysophospholipid acyltransferase family protein [Hyphomicrobiaceae bacterium]